MLGQVNSSNNAGDTPWHWARNMGNKDVMALLEKVKQGNCKFRVFGIRALNTGSGPSGSGSLGSKIRKWITGNAGLRFWGSGYRTLVYKCGP